MRSAQPNSRTTGNQFSLSKTFSSAWEKSINSWIVREEDINISEYIFLTKLGQSSHGLEFENVELCSRTNGRKKELKNIARRALLQKALTKVATNLKGNVPFPSAKHYANHFYYIQTINNDIFSYVIGTKLSDGSPH